MVRNGFAILVILSAWLTLAACGSAFSHAAPSPKESASRNTAEAQRELSASCLSCLKESMELVREYGDQVWKGFSKLHVRVNIITPHYEFFFGDAFAPQGYEYLSDDQVLGETIYFKKREYRHEFTSTIHPAGDNPAVFISSKEVFEATYRKSPLYKIAEDYIFMMVQQLFHLFLMQNEQMAGNLSDSGQSDIRAAGEQYPYLDFINARLLEIEGEELVDALRALNAKERGTARESVQNFLKVRSMRLRQMQGDYHADLTKYENWMELYEGLGKYTEIEIARCISLKGYRAPVRMARVSNFRNYSFVKNKQNFELERLKSTRNTLIHQSMGMTEALILDRTSIRWKDEVLKGEKSLVDFLREFAEHAPEKTNYY